MPPPTVCALRSWLRSKSACQHLRRKQCCGFKCCVVERTVDCFYTCSDISNLPVPATVCPSQLSLQHKQAELWRTVWTQKSTGRTTAPSSCFPQLQQTLVSVCRYEIPVRVVRQANGSLLCDRHQML